MRKMIYYHKCLLSYLPNRKIFNRKVLQNRFKLENLRAICYANEKFLLVFLNLYAVKLNFAAFIFRGFAVGKTKPRN